MLSNLENKIRIKLLKKSKNTAVKILNIQDLNQSNTNDYDDVFTGKSDYLLINNFISETEIKKILDNLKTVVAEHNIYQEKTKTGMFLGNSLLEKNKIEDYFTAAQKYHEDETRLLGFSYNERIKDLIQRISSLHAVEIPKNKSGQSYLGNSIRILESNKSAFPAHTDKYVHDTSPKSAELNECISDENMISFFALIKPSEKGGRLFIFHKKYKDTPQEILNEIVHGDYTNVQRYIYKHDVIEVSMKPGDLILFDAGQRWHFVEPIYGKTERITVGCFTSYNKNKDKIYYWS